MVFKKKKKLEEMSKEELMQELSKLNKNSQFKPRKFESGPNGELLLDRNNKQDIEWYENDKDYDILK
ncbi:hypothetical protein [Metabacillus fastidiosus]|uniref:hypothetical protein n=1 Tax=Metabacillus fastidiosus TaxID=1458 RepID=UPI003D2CFDE0